MGSDRAQRLPQIDTGLIWGVDCGTAGHQPFDTLDAAPATAFRWLHLNLADQRARHWVQQAPLPPRVRDALLSSDPHQRAFVEEGVVCGVFHDLEREYDGTHTGRVSAVRVALSAEAIITSRVHPLGFADIARRRLSEGAAVSGPADALELLGGAIVAHLEAVLTQLTASVQAVEDGVLAGRDAGDRSGLLGLRRRIGLIRRVTDGMARAVRRLEGDALPFPALAPALARLVQQLAGLDGDAASLQAQLLLVRDEIELQANRQINQNLMLLSVMTALMLPVTVVTGIFGMNTGSMWLTGRGGTLAATGVALLLAALTYLFLRGRGFFR